MRIRVTQDGDASLHYEHDHAPDRDLIESHIILLQYALKYQSPPQLPDAPH